MGELYRKAQQQRTDKPSLEQLRYLRDLLMEQDGEVDEEWLSSLTGREASEEISRRTGERRRD